MGVFARGWLGLGVCATARVRLWCLRALVCALAWGWWDNHCPAAPFAPLACLLACSRLWCGRCWRVRGTAFPDGRRAALLGRDNRVPPHTAWRGLLRSPRGAEERGVACGVLPVC